MKIDTSKFPIQKTEEEWKKQLTQEEYHILREKGTEPPDSGIYTTHFEKGTYKCKGCGQSLFDSNSKFQTHCGWPAFDQSVDGAIIYQKDLSHGLYRIEIICSQCASHLGHVFNDGPTQTHLRYCVNSLSIHFESKKHCK